MRNPEPAITQLIHDHSLGMNCRECQALAAVAPRQLLLALIEDAAVQCPRCDAEYDVWRRMVEDLSFGVFGRRYAAVGANVVVAQLRLRRDQPALLDFQTLGIPESAEIEEVVLTPYGSVDGILRPVFLKDPSIGQPASEKPVIYPVPMGTGPAETQVNVLIVWTSQSAAADPPQAALLAGVRAAHSGDHLGAIISSSAAMELALGSAMSSWLESHSIGRDRRKQFLESEATYGPQLSVLLPVAAAAVGLAPLPERAKAALARLRNLRNDVAHGGLQAATISDADIADCLAGAAVGVVYCEAFLAQLG